MFCSKEDHLKDYKFCSYCCIDMKKPIKSIFFCNKCSLQIKKQHLYHEEKVYNLNGTQFNNSVKFVRDVLKSEIKSKSSNDKQLENSIQFYSILQNDYNFEAIIWNEKFMSWLYKISFFQCQKTKNNVKTYINGKISTSKIKQTKQFEKGQFKISWDTVQQANIDQEISSLSSAIQKQNKNKQILAFIFRLFQPFNQQQYYQILDSCEQLNKKYQNSLLLNLAQIKICELLPKKNEDIDKILSKIAKFSEGFSKTDIYFYYRAMSNWLICQKEDRKGKIFVQQKNKKYYRLKNSNDYIKSLETAIQIRSRPIYYLSLGIGYLAQQNLAAASTQFQKITNYQSQSLDLLRFWIQAQINKNYDFNLIMRNIETRPIFFILNLCHYFKKNKKYKQLCHCCEILITKQPQNIKFKIEFVKAKIYFGSANLNFDQNINNQLLNIENIIFQLKNANNQESEQLQIRLLRFKINQKIIKQKNLQGARQFFQKLLKLSRVSGSDYYNYAACLFQLYVQDNDEYLLRQSRSMIEKALEKKDKPKFKKLKFFIECYLNQYNYAAQTLQSGCQIDSVKYQEIIQFIQQNKE